MLFKLTLECVVGIIVATNQSWGCSATDHRKCSLPPPVPKGWTSEGWTWCSFPQSGEEGGEDQDGEGRKGRKKIRKILKDDKLRTETRDALKEEEERRKRIAEREALREKLREVKMKCAAVIRNIDSIFKALSCCRKWKENEEFPLNISC